MRRALLNRWFSASVTIEAVPRRIGIGSPVFSLGEKTVESSLGQACVSAGRHDDAIAHYRRVLQLDPQDAGNRLNLANQLFHKGDLAGAREQAAKALELPLSEHGQQVAVDLIQKTQ